MYHLNVDSITVKDVYVNVKATTKITHRDIVKKPKEEIKWNHKKYLIQK